MLTFRCLFHGNLIITFLAIMLISACTDTPPASENNENNPAANDNADTSQKKDPFRVVTMVSEAVKRPLKVWLTGETEAGFRVTVRAETAGQIIKRPIDKGNRVRKGDILCQIDPGTQAAEIARAEAALAKAEFDLSASMKLYKTGNVAENRIQEDRARVNAARADLAASRLNEERLIITAPTDGIIEGPLPEVGDQLTIGTACATIVSYDPIIITGQFSERYLDKILLGAVIEARIGHGIQTQGTIDYIAASADPQTRTFRMEANIDNADGQIGEGMSARFSVTLSEKAIHSIPRIALSLNEEGIIGVKTLVDNKVHFVPVTIVTEKPDGIWVSAEPPQMTLITLGHEYVLENQTVKPVDHMALEN